MCGVGRLKIRDAQALSNLLMMLEIAEVLAIRLGLIVIETQQRSQGKRMDCSVSEIASN
jgi:hypothetical protein